MKQSSARIGVGPPDPVTGIDRQPLLLEGRKSIVRRTGTDPARPMGSCLTLAIDEEHLARLLVDPVDLVFAAWEPLMFIGAPNIEDHARAVCRDIAGLLTRCIDPWQDGQVERCLDRKSTRLNSSH